MVLAGLGELYRTHNNLSILEAFHALTYFPNFYDDTAPIGIHDYQTFTFAKEILKKFDKEKDNQPFTMIINTMDNHFEFGFTCKKCIFKHPKHNLLDTYTCVDKTVRNFLDYLNTLDMYKDTSIIVLGDHFTMANSIRNLINDKNPKYDRRVYNAFINSEAKLMLGTNRVFGTFDFFPIILAALGYKIKGEKLGLGTNLFSSKKKRYLKGMVLFMYQTRICHKIKI